MIEVLSTAPAAKCQPKAWGLDLHPDRQAARTHQERPLRSHVLLLTLVLATGVGCVTPASVKTTLKAQSEAYA